MIFLELPCMLNMTQGWGDGNYAYMGEMGKGTMFHCHLVSWLIIPDAGCPDAGFMAELEYSGAMWASRLVRCYDLI